MILDRTKLEKNYVDFFENKYGKPVEELADDIVELLQSYGITEETINRIVDDLECWFGLLGDDAKETLDYFQKTSGFGKDGDELAFIAYLLTD